MSSTPTRRGWTASCRNELSRSSLNPCKHPHSSVNFRMVGILSKPAEYSNWLHIDSNSSFARCKRHDELSVIKLIKDIMKEKEGKSISQDGLWWPILSPAFFKLWALPTLSFLQWEGQSKSLDIALDDQYSMPSLLFNIAWFITYLRFTSLNNCEVTQEEANLCMIKNKAPESETLNLHKMTPCDRGSTEFAAAADSPDRCDWGNLSEDSALQNGQLAWCDEENQLARVKVAGIAPKRMSLHSIYRGIPTVRYRQETLTRHKIRRNDGYDGRRVSTEPDEVGKSQEAILSLVDKLISID